MMDDEKTENSEATPTGPVEGDESSDAAPAGPVAEDDSSSSQAAGDEAPSTPPADETPETSEAEADSTPPADETPEDSKAEEEPAAEESDAGDKKKKDVIPGADLEPIAVEPAEEKLSAEERARREAEAEERERREAELVGGSEEEEPQVSSRAPAKLESGSRFLATGKRKRSIARVTLLPGSGKIEVNKRSLEEFFPRPLHQTMARQPLTTTGYEGNVDVRIRVHGGGISGQAGAVRHGIARALTEIDPELRGELKRRGFLTRDARVKERRKAGLKKARKRPQFSKR